MLAAFFRGVGQLSDKKTRQTVWLSLFTSGAAFACLWTVVGYLITETVLFEMLWLETAVDIFGGLATLVMTWLLFPAITGGVIGLLLDRIADQVEARHYPGLPDAQGISFAAGLMVALRFMGVLIGLNLLLLPFLLFPLAFPFIFYSANGYLLSREYFELVGLRRLSLDKVTELRRNHKVQLFFAGVLIALLLTVPIVNFFAPIIATAAMVHLFERWRRAEAG
ncbi:MAG: EI24 domain-containing protein [Rhodospirillales bacterium]|nr:EI24 domain-containing protein [Rhodospirillales bacterium]